MKPMDFLFYKMFYVLKKKLTQNLWLVNYSSKKKKKKGECFLPFPKKLLWKRKKKMNDFKHCGYEGLLTSWDYIFLLLFSCTL